MMLEHVNRADLAKRLRSGRSDPGEDNVLTGDLGGKATTKEFSRAVVRRLS
jgi:isocitrate dehydrogenase (NAD+)